MVKQYVPRVLLQRINKPQRMNMWQRACRKRCDLLPPHYKAKQRLESKISLGTHNKISVSKTYPTLWKRHSFCWYKDQRKGSLRSSLPRSVLMPSFCQEPRTENFIWKMLTNGLKKGENVLFGLIQPVKNIFTGTFGHSGRMVTKVSAIDIVFITESFRCVY